MEQTFLRQCAALKPFLERTTNEVQKQKQVDALARILHSLPAVEDPASLVSSILDLDLNPQMQGFLVDKVTALAVAKAGANNTNMQNYTNLWACVPQVMWQAAPSD